MKRVENIRVSYVPSETRFFQGNEFELQKMKDKGWKVASGSNGSYNLYKPVKVFIHFTEESGSHSFEAKELIKAYYGIGRISEKTCDKFEREANSGKVSVMYDSMIETIDIK